MCSGLERRRSVELKARNLLSLVSQDLGFLHMFRVRSFCWSLPQSQKNKRLLGDFVSLTFRSYTHKVSELNEDNSGHAHMDGESLQCLNLTQKLRATVEC